MSDTSINRAYKQEVNFVFQDTWAERTRLYCIFRLEAFVYAKFVYAKP